ncbi:MAG: hypothetical protein NTX72_05220 [Candidatus Uhrbacteria bacterium]|nr:hypothetical protein [Candidatus Uhrbacteria bacterium]
MFFHKILVIAPLALLCTGCPSDPIGSHDSSTVQTDGYSPDGGSTDNGSDAGSTDGSSGGWEDVKVTSTEGYITINAKTPDGKPADFYVCDEVSSCTSFGDPSIVPTNPTYIFKNVDSIKVQTAANIKFGNTFGVRVMRPDHLFVDWNFTAKGNPDKQFASGYTHEWTDVGSWGLAPNGTYQDSSDNKKKSVATNVVNDKIVLTVGKSGLAYITGDQLIESDSMSSLGLKVSGVIQPDLLKISIHTTDGTDSQDGILTKQ